MATFTLAEPKPVMVPIADIDVTEYDLRHDALGDIEGLKASIKSRGLMNAIKVRPHNGRFDLIAGRRRLEAVSQLGAPKIPAVVEQTKDADLVLDMLIENFQREDLTPRQKAVAFAAAAATGMSQKKIADAVGTSQPSVSKLIALLDLPEEVLDALDAGGIKQHEAEELLRLKDDPDTLVKVFKAAKDDASLRRALVKAVKQADEARAGAVQKAAKARTRKELVLTFTIAQFIQMTEGTQYFEAACDVLNIPRVNREQGFGEVYDVETWLAANADENPLRLLYTVALVRGHMPLVGAKDQLPEFDAAFAGRTLEQLQTAVGYDVSLAEISLVTGEEFKRVEVKKEAKTEGKTEAKATAPRKPNISKLPGAVSAEGTPRHAPGEGDIPAGQAICAVCEGMGTVVHEGHVIECPNPNCKEGWVPSENVESTEGEGA
jgi:ParB/RepB/Spo0J family partition protein